MRSHTPAQRIRRHAAEAIEIEMDDSKRLTMRFMPQCRRFIAGVVSLRFRFSSKICRPTQII
jgi:hypothetical protein